MNIFDMGQFFLNIVKHDKIQYISNDILHEDQLRLSIVWDEESFLVDCPRNGRNPPSAVT